MWEDVRYLGSYYSGERQMSVETVKRAGRQLPTASKCEEFFSNTRAAIHMLPVTERTSRNNQGLIKTHEEFMSRSSNGDRKRSTITSSGSILSK